MLYYPNLVPPPPTHPNDVCDQVSVALTPTSPSQMPWMACRSNLTQSARFLNAIASHEQLIVSERLALISAVLKYNHSEIVEYSFIFLLIFLPYIPFL